MLVLCPSRLWLGLAKKESETGVPRAGQALCGGKNLGCWEPTEELLPRSPSCKSTFSVIGFREQLDLWRDSFQGSPWGLFPCPIFMAFSPQGPSPVHSSSSWCSPCFPPTSFSSISFCLLTLHSLHPPIPSSCNFSFGAPLWTAGPPSWWMSASNSMHACMARSCGLSLLPHPCSLGHCQFIVGSCSLSSVLCPMGPVVTFQGVTRDSLFQRLVHMLSYKRRYKYAIPLVTRFMNYVG